MRPSDPEVIARRLFQLATNQALLVEPGLQPGQLSSADLIWTAHQCLEALEAGLKAKKFDPHHTMADAAFVAAIAYSVLRNEGLLTRVEYPEVVERM